MKLTEHMRDALQQARHAPLRRVHNPALAGNPPWPAHASTLAALERHELVTTDKIRNRHGYHVQVWTITDTGRQALEPREVFRHERNVYLAPPGFNPETGTFSEFTTDPSRGSERVPITDPATLDDAWAQISDQRRAAAEDRRAAARRRARAIRRAA